jgi:hypothetical protein
VVPRRSIAKVLALLAFGLTSCSGASHPAIVGKWLTPRAELVEFKPDGTVTESKFGNVLLTGTYRWLDQQTLEINSQSFDKPVVSRLTIKVVGGALNVVADGVGEPEQFTRAP